MSMRWGMVILLAGIVAQSCEDGTFAAEGERYAFLVGVNKYAKDELNDLKYSEADIEELGKVLIESGYPEKNVVRMTLTAGAKDPRYLPDGARVRKELALILGEARPEDTVVVGLAGHGIQFVDDKQAYFCPQDAKLAERDTLISIQEMQEQMTASKAKFKLLLIDACRNDPQAEASRSSGAAFTMNTPIIQRESPEGLISFYSCAAGERAWEHEELKHGVFFYFLIQGMRGGAVSMDSKTVTLKQLDEFVSKSTARYVRDKYAARQKPEVSKKGMIADDMPLAFWTKAAPPVTAGSVEALFAAAGAPSKMLPAPGGEYQADLYSAKKQKVQRVTYFRRLTQNKLADHEGKMEPIAACISDDGSKIAFFGPAFGLWTVNFDGTGLTKVLTEFPGKRDIDINWLLLSPDGQTIYYQVFGTGIYRVGSDGSDPRAIVLAGSEYEPLRLREKGRRIYYGRRDGIYSIDIYGNGDLRKHMTQPMLLKLFDRGDLLCTAFDVDESGTRLVFKMFNPEANKHQIFGINTDGTGFHLVADPKAEPHTLNISPDGSTVTYTEYIGRTYLTDWDGTNSREFVIPRDFGSSGYGSGGARRFSADSRWWTHFQPEVGPHMTPVEGNGKGRFEVFHTVSWTKPGGFFNNPTSVASFSGDLRRFTYITMEGGRPRQLIAGEINPAKMDGAPIVTDVEFPARLSTNNQLPNNIGPLRCKVAPGKEPVKEVRFTGSPSVQFKEEHEDANRRWSYGAGQSGLKYGGVTLLLDDGQNGDVKAGDGEYFAQIIPYAGNFEIPKPTAKFMTRIHVQTENTAVLVDVDGFTVGH